MEIKTMIHEPDTEGRDDAAFYVWDANAHQHIGSITYGDREVAIYCDGEMRFNLWGTKAERELGGAPRVVRYCDELTYAGIRNDDDLYRAIDGDRIDVVNNAWFDLYLSDELRDGDHADVVTHTLTDAIAAARDLITNDEAWK